MRQIIIAFLMSVSLFGANILNVNIKELKDKIEIFFNFDVPYEGTIIQKVEKDKIRILLKGASIERVWLKKIDTPYVYQIELMPKGPDSELLIYTVEKTAVMAAKSSDGYGLKLLIKKLSAPIQKPTPQKSGVAKYLLQAVGVLAVIALFVVILFFLISKSRPKVKKKSINLKTEKEKAIKIRFEKALDEHNKLALISFKGVNYLVIIGSTNILLGKYKEEEIESEEDFNKLFEENKNEIDSIFSPKDDETPSEFDLYKEKASKGPSISD